jgi:hypothetical protein
LPEKQGTNNWFVGNVNGETPRNATISFDFLDKGKKYMATIYADAKKRITKPTHKPIQFEKIAVTNKSKISQPSAA